MPIFSLNFKNISSKTVDGFAFDLKMKQQLTPENYGHPAIDGHFIFNESVSTKVYPGQTVSSKAFNVMITSHTIHQILGSGLTITIYTEQDQESKEYQVEQLFKITPPNESHREPEPLSLKMFISSFVLPSQHFDGK